MEARSLAEALKLIMEQRGCSQNQLARDLGVAQSWISEVIHGKRDTPTAKAISLLARVGWEVRITPKTESDESVKRREFVAAAASVMLVPSREVGPYQDPSYLRALAKRVARDRHEHGGATIASSAIRHIRRVEPVIASSDRELQTAASDLAVEAVRTMNDAQRFDAGESIGRLALELSRRSGNNDAQSRAYSVLSQINTSRGEADRALAYAKEGVKLPDVTDAQQAWMRLRLGWSLATMSGQRSTSRDVIDSVRGPLEDTNGFYGQSQFDVAEMTGSVGRALSDLGAHEEAETPLREAVNHLAHSSPLVQGHCLTRLITAALHASEPSQAASDMLRLARVVPLVNSTRLDSYVREVIAASARWHAMPEMRDARDQLREVTTPISKRA
jgi:transcriptional regulator with XRE-family HTH domain